MSLLHEHIVTAPGARRIVSFLPIEDSWTREERWRDRAPILKVHGRTGLERYTIERQLAALGKSERGRHGPAVFLPLLCVAVTAYPARLDSIRPAP
jgi:hypothetical protein